MSGHNGWHFDIWFYWYIQYLPSSSCHVMFISSISYYLQKPMLHMNILFITIVSPYLHVCMSHRPIYCSVCCVYKYDNKWVIKGYSICSNYKLNTLSSCALLLPPTLTITDICDTWNYVMC
jgi:hypothetical protein